MLGITRVVRRACGLLIICGGSFSGMPAAAQLYVVAVAGEQVPGAPAGTTFTSLNLGGINDPGMTALVAETSAGLSVVVEHQGAFRTVATQGDAAPGAPAGYAFDAFPFIVLNDAGQVAFVANYSPDGSGQFDGPGFGGPGFALWSEASGALQPIALRDAAMPGASGPAAGSALFREFSIPAFNATGESAFLSTNKSCDGVGSNTCYQGAFYRDEVALKKLAITADPAPVPGGTFLFFPFTFDALGSDVAVALNDFGDAAFVADFETDEDFGNALWMASGGALTPIIQSGMPAPVSPSGPKFDYMGFSPAIAMNNSGHVAARWELAPGSGVGNSNDGAIWTGDVNEVRLVAREGEPAPGAALNFFSFGDPLINDADEIVFRAATGPLGQGVGIWAERAGVLEHVAIEGQSAPDVPAGAVFDGFYDPSINSAGQIVFYATLKVGEGGITEENNAGLWAQDIQGVLRLMAREGEQVDVDRGAGIDLRVFSDFSIQSSGIFLGAGSGNQDGRPSYFNDRGQLAFWASFTDGGSGVFISNMVAVPEPPVSAWVIIMSLVFSMIRPARNHVRSMQPSS